MVFCTSFRAIFVAPKKKTIRVTNYATSFGAKNVQKTRFEAAEIIVDPWNQQSYEQALGGMERERKEEYPLGDLATVI